MTLAQLRKLAASIHPDLTVVHEVETSRYRCMAPDGFQFEAGLDEVLGDYLAPGMSPAIAREWLGDSLSMYTELEAF